MSEAAFVNAGKFAGLELWRIENFVPVKLPNVTGKYHKGDSYILLSSVQKTHGGSLSWKIHFWLGSETSLDEAGTAARKAVELDEALGGAAVQYREVEGNESEQFLSYFKNNGGIEYLPGGVLSGFRKVENDVFPTRLLHLKGKRTVRVKEVPLALSSLNSDDVFILDKGLKIFIFNGPTANRFEKIKGVEVASRIKGDERNGRAEIIFLDDSPEHAEFWEVFGGYHDPASLPTGESDAASESTTATATTTSTSRQLFRISNATGSLLFTDVTPASGKLSKDLLDTNDVFLVRGLGDRFFLWVGKSSNLQEKREATSFALKYFEQNHIPMNTQLERVSEGVESNNFKAEFAVWDAPVAFNQWKSTGVAAPSADVSIDVAALSAYQLADTPVDDGSGSLQVWVVHGPTKTLLSTAEHGQFYDSECYILLYTYAHPKRRETSYIAYFWLGKYTSPDEKGYAALLTKELDDEYAGKAVQTRVTQGKEPTHFRQLFNGKMVVYHGKRGASSTGNDLFHVRGTTALNISAVQTPESVAAALNSQDTFVLVTNANVFAWYGQYSSAVEQSFALNTATAFTAQYRGVCGGGRTLVELKEGNESGEFWNALGGKGSYPHEHVEIDAFPREARLLHVSTASGRFTVVPVDNYDQTDLNNEDIFILDTFSKVFVWIGGQSSAEERSKAMHFAQQYIEEVNDGRNCEETSICKIHAGQEPLMFTAYFQSWDDGYMSKQTFQDPYEAKLAAVRKVK